MQSLGEWLRGAEEKAKKLSAIAKSKARLEKQLHELEVSI